MQGQVKWPHLTKNFTIAPQLECLREGYMKLSEYDRVIGTYKMYISDFFIYLCYLGQVIFETSPVPIMSIDKNQTPCFTLYLELIWMESHYVR